MHPVLYACIIRRYEWTLRISDAAGMLKRSSMRLQAQRSCDRSAGVAARASAQPKPSAIDRWEHRQAEISADELERPHHILGMEALRSDIARSDIASRMLGNAMALLVMNASELTSACSSCLANDSGEISGLCTPPEGWHPCHSTCAFYMPSTSTSTSARDPPGDSPAAAPVVTHRTLLAELDGTGRLVQ